MGDAEGDPAGDPRVFFAAERTLLAWMRSGLTIMGLGFVVARFGLFLGMLAAAGAGAQEHLPHWPSEALGIALVAFGALAILGALWNHLAYVKTLPREDVPRLPLPWLTALLCAAAAFVGLVLAIYLALT